MVTLRKNYETFSRAIDYSSTFDRLPDDIIHFLYSRKCNDTVHTLRHHECLDGKCQDCGWGGFITFDEEPMRSKFEVENDVNYTKQPNDVVRYSFYEKEPNDFNIQFILRTKLIPFSEFLVQFEKDLQKAVKKVVHTANQKKTASLCSTSDESMSILGMFTLMFRRDYSMKPKFKQDAYETTDNFRGGRSFSVENIIAYFRGDSNSIFTLKSIFFLHFKKKIEEKFKFPTIFQI